MSTESNRPSAVPLAGLPSWGRLWVVLSLAAFALTAADPASKDPGWKTKPASQWSEEDAKQLLTDSPWVKFATPRQVADRSPSARREGGDWDANIGRGAGIAGTGILGSERAAEAIENAHAKPALPPVTIHWESALPVRLAEEKARISDAPMLDGDDYAIAIYDIPAPKRWKLASELKGLATLRRGGKKDLKPARVEILRHDDETSTIVYLFPRSAEIARKDRRIEFRAQVGQLVVDENFYIEDMQIQGELQLLMPTN